MDIVIQKICSDFVGFYVDLLSTLFFFFVVNKINTVYTLLFGF